MKIPEVFEEVSRVCQSNGERRRVVVVIHTHTAGMTFLRTSPTFLLNATKLLSSNPTTPARLLTRILNNSSWKRGLATAFDRSLPHLNIGTIGHVDHGKTTLTAVFPPLFEEC